MKYFLSSIIKIFSEGSQPLLAPVFGICIGKLWSAVASTRANSLCTKFASSFSLIPLNLTFHKRKFKIVCNVEKLGVGLGNLSEPSYTSLIIHVNRNELKVRMNEVV